MPIQSYPNQKMIYVNREMPKQTKENKRSYMIAYNDNIEAAMQVITKISSFKLYIYLLGNTDNYHFALSTQDVADRCGINIKSAKEAVNDLIEKGYLVLREKKTYDFYEVAQKEIEPTEEVKKEFKVNGVATLLTYEELVNTCSGNKERAADLWRRNTK